MRRVLREHAGGTAAEIVEALHALVASAVGTGRLEDDLTMVVVKVVAA